MIAAAGAKEGAMIVGEMIAAVVLAVARDLMVVAKLVRCVTTATSGASHHFLSKPQHSNEKQPARGVRMRYRALSRRLRRRSW